MIMNHLILLAVLTAVIDKCSSVPPTPPAQNSQLCFNPSQELCENLCADCTPSHTFYALHGDNYTLHCGGATIFRFRRLEETRGEEITLFPSEKYTIMVGSLVIHNVDKNDEGTYTCASDGGSLDPMCLHVLGTSRFATCDIVNGSQIRYDTSSELVPNRVNSCFQEVTMEGGRVELDTRLQYTGFGACGCVEKVTFFEFRKLSSSTRYSCQDIRSPICNITDTSKGLSTRRESSDPYDFNLVFSNLSPSDSGEYRVTLTLQFPNQNNNRFLYKVIEVIITTEPTDPPQATSTGISTGTSSNDPTGPTGDPVVDVASVAGGTVAGIIIVILIIILLAMGLALIYKRSVTDSSSLEKIKMPINSMTSDDKPVEEPQIVAYHVTTLTQAFVETSSGVEYSRYSRYCDNVDLPSQSEGEVEEHV